MKPNHPIEGEWSEFLFRMVEISDIPAILYHLKENFHVDEPITFLCPPDDTFVDFMNPKIGQLLEKHLHLSFIALKKSTNEIAGCQLQFKWTKEEAMMNSSRSSTGTANSGPHEEIPNTRKIFNKIMAPLDKPKADLFDKYGVDFLGWNFIASTTRKFRGRGLASEMYRRMVILLRAENFMLAMSVFTSPFTRRCAEKVGFAEIARVVMADVIDENGEKVLPNSTKDDIASLMVLQL